MTTYEVFLAFALLIIAIGAFRLVRRRSIGWRCPPAKTRGEPLRPSAVAFLASFLLMIALLAFGVVVFPYAPIRQVGGAFVDKRGQLYTAEDYRWFRRWEWIAQVTGAACGLSALYNRVLEPYLLARRKRQERRDAG